jgi:hypothetical protein
LFIGGGGAPFNFSRRHKIFSGAPAAARPLETPDPNFTLSVQYIFTFTIEIIKLSIFNAKKSKNFVLLLSVIFPASGKSIRLNQLI